MDMTNMKKKWLGEGCLGLALLVGLCGAKPSPRVIKGVARRLAFLQRLKQASREARGFSMRGRPTRGAYKQHELLLAATLTAAGSCPAVVTGATKWNCAAKIRNAALKVKRQGAIGKRVDARVRGKTASLRSAVYLRPQLQAC